MKTGTKAERKAAEAIMSKAEAIVERSVAAIKDATQQPVTPNGTPEGKVQKTSYVVDDKGLNKYGVEGTVLFAAGQALARKKITQDGYRAVCQAEWTLDEAVAAKLLGDAVSIHEEQTIEIEKPKKATANPDKKRKTQPKKEKPPKETTPPAGWTIEVLDDDGNTLETVSSDIPRKEILVKFGGSSMGEARKNIANDKGKKVRFTNNKTEKVYVSKPKK